MSTFWYLKYEDLVARSLNKKSRIAFAGQRKKAEQTTHSLIKATCQSLIVVP